jgi:hypothetical protein
MTTLDPLMPTLASPAPSKDREPGSITPEEVESVVFPTAKTLSVGLVWAAVVAPDIISAPASAAVVEKPTETPPAPETEKLVRDCVVDDDTVVLPIAYSLCAVADAGAADTEMIAMLLDEYPTDAIPAPLRVTDLASKVVELDKPVVLPEAKPPIVWIVCGAVVAPEITIVLFENPREIPPAPERASPSGNWLDDELVKPVVLPTADQDRDPWLAAGGILVAEIIRILSDEYPTETIPPPLTVTDRASKLVLLLDPVVFPVAKPAKVWTDWLAEMINDEEAKPTEAIPAPEIVRALTVDSEVVSPVVFPAAKNDDVAAAAVAPETMMVPPEKPTLAPAVPENVKALAIDSDVVDPAVLPIAK